MNPAYPPSAPPGAGMTHSRAFDLMEELRGEFSSLENENGRLLSLRQDFHRKVEENIAELQQMEQDRKHQAMKEHYESEISRLKGVASGQDRASNQARQDSQGVPSSLPDPAMVPQNPGNPSAPGGMSNPSDPQGQGGDPVDPQGQSQPGGPPKRLSLPSASHGFVPSGGPSQPGGPGPPQGRSSAVGGGPPGSSQAQGQQGVQGAQGPGGPQGPGHGSALRASPLQGISTLASGSHSQPLPSVVGVGGTGAGGAGGGAAPGGVPSAPPPPRLIVGGPDVGGSGVVPAIIKKDPTSQSMPPQGPGPIQPNLGGGAPGLSSAPTQQSSEDQDYVVFPGMDPTGAVVEMGVALQNTLHHDSVVCCVRYSWNGDFLATGSNRSAQIFDVQTGQRVAVFSKDDGGQDMEDPAGNDSYVRAVCFSPDGNWLITGAEDHVVKVWDVHNRTVKFNLCGHETDIYSVDASANSQFIISGSGDKKAKLWSLDSGKLLATLGGEHGPTDGITSVSVSPTSKHVAAGSLDKVVRVWDVESSRLMRQFQGHRDSVYSVAFSPDGRLLLSGSLDKTLKLWDLSAPQPAQHCRQSYSGHKDFVLSVAFSPNSQWLISGSKDRSVQFWDSRQPTMSLTLQGHRNSVISIAHNPVTASLATGSGDCRARVWSCTW